MGYKQFYEIIQSQFRDTENANVWRKCIGMQGFRMEEETALNNVGASY